MRSIFTVSGVRFLTCFAVTALYPLFGYAQQTHGVEQAIHLEIPTELLELKGDSDFAQSKATDAKPSVTIMDAPTRIQKGSSFVVRVSASDDGGLKGVVGKIGDNQETVRLSGKSQQTDIRLVAPTMPGNYQLTVGVVDIANQSNIVTRSVVVSSNDSVAAPQPQHSISSAQPVSALQLNQQATFNLSGSNLTSGQIRISMNDCDSNSVQVLSATQARFSCIPRVAGNQRLFWKAPGSETSITLGNFNVAQPAQAPQPTPQPAPQPTPQPAPQPQLSIASAQPVSALQLNQQATFNLSGSNLTSGQIRISMNDCDSNSVQVLSATQARFSCIPRVAGNQRLFWKAPGSETSITLGNFNVAQSASATQPVIQPTPQPAPPRLGNLQAWQQQSLDYAAQYLRDYGDRPLERVGPNRCGGGNTYCYAFSRLSPGINLGAYGSAIESFEHWRQLGTASVSSDFNSVPLGAVVFFGATAKNKYGHAAIKVDSENVVSQGQDGAFDCTITKRPFRSSGFGAVVGYYAPTSGATGTDPDTIPPQLRISRGEFMAKLSTVLSQLDPSLPADPITKAQQMGIVSNPATLNSDPIIRQDAGRMLDRVIVWYEAKGWKFPSAPEPRFDRDTTIADEFRPTANRLASFGIFKGVQEEDGRFEFHGKGQLQRNEAEIVANRLASLLASATKPSSSPPPQTQPTVSIATAQPMGALEINQQATFNLSGNNLTSGQIRISMNDCDSNSVQVLSATQARFSCIPRVAGNQRLFWKAPGSETSITLGNFNVAQPPSSQSPTTQQPNSQLSADPHEMWRNWQSGPAAIKKALQLRDGRASNMSPAEIIYYSAQENNINPITIITKLQGEQGLVEGSYAGTELVTRLELATGYGARVGAKWFGFYPQVVGLSYQFDQFAQQGMSFSTAYQTYTQDVRGPFSQFQTLYAKYAGMLNRIAGTNFSTTPNSEGYYRNFLNVSPQHLHTLLQQTGGVLSNARLFGGNGQVGTSSGPQTGSTPAQQVRIDSVTPLTGITGRSHTFTVQGNGLPQTLAINLDGERCYNDQKPALNQVVCDLTKVGLNPVLQIKDKPGGVVLGTYSFTVAPAPVATQVPEAQPNSPVTQYPQPVPVPATDSPGLPAGITVSVSNQNPRMGESVLVNLQGTLPRNSSDIYLYLKVEQLGGQVTWYYNKRLNDSGASPWRTNVSGPSLPESNPVFQFTPKYLGRYVVGVVLRPTGQPVSFSDANEAIINVKQ